MCKLGLVFLISLLTGNNYAQNYFVLLQSDNRQPFYVRLGGQHYSSSPEGHLILAQLKDSTYTIAIGFPSQPGAEQTYSIGTAQKDQELLIRERSDAGWGLFDPQTREWLTVIARSGGREEVRAIGVRRDDAFSRLMAGVVRDTAVLYNDYASADLAISGSATTPAATSAPPAAAGSSSRPGTTPSNAATTTSSNAVTTPSNAATTASSATDTALATIPAPANTTPTSPASANTAVKPPAANPPAAASRPDTVKMNPTPLYRPTSGNAQHKSAPMFDSSTGGSLYRPTPGIVKVSEKRLTRNMRLVYADKGNGAKADTVVVMIPLDTIRTAGAKPRSASPDSARTANARSTGPDSIHITKSRSISLDSTRTVKSHPAVLDSNRAAKLHPTPDSGKATAGGTRGPNPDSPSLGSSVRVIIPSAVNLPADKTRAHDSAQKPVTKAALPYVNSDCHNFATDYDIDKLRVKMLEASKDEDRVAAALKVFKTKCFFTRQIRALSEVFATDAGKFRFFETAYPFAADEHFHELGTLLADAAYINKFKTLTGSH